MRISINYLTIIIIVTVLVSSDAFSLSSKYRINRVQSNFKKINHLKMMNIVDLESSNPLVSAAFNVATFGPQPFWLLMTFLPRSEFTKKLMGSWITIGLFSLVHLFIVAVSISQPDGTAPITEV
jgi:hypothetical protein